ncbi:MAG TPA: hypothetical protein VHC67_07950 [Gaiellaceae bacterium]|jgi:hypothetical protein|nr:hypothetical protein [Gaiellaceae bacterium]
MSTTAPRADAAAASVGASDLFVLRRVNDDRFVHFGGAGRGSGWAGLIEVTSSESDALARSLETRTPVRLPAGEKALVFGPYYARSAVFVPVTNDVVVVFGAEQDELDGAAEEALRNAAASAADAVGQVTPAKLLADELEELEAVRAAVAAETGDVVEAMRTLALLSAEALSCEVAALYLADGERLEVVDRGWQLSSEHARVAAALRGVLEENRFPYCVQDATVVPLPSPLDEESGVRSYYLLELRGLARGVLFLAHTDADPRGFTLLCRKLGLRLADVVSAKLGVALTQEWCRGEATRLHAAFGKLDAG